MNNRNLDADYDADYAFEPIFSQRSMDSAQATIASQDAMITDLNDRLADYLVMIERLENTIDELVDILDTRGSGS